MISRLRLQLAALLRRLAARLDPMPQHFGPVEPDDAEGEFADRLILQMALHRALHRYHPAPPTPQA